MGCNREVTEQEAQEIHDAAMRVASEAGGTDVAKAERYVQMYGEAGARAILRAEESMARAVAGGVPSSYGSTVELSSRASALSTTASASYAFERPNCLTANQWSQPAPVVHATPSTHGAELAPQSPLAAPSTDSYRWSAHNANFNTDMSHVPVGTKVDISVRDANGTIVRRGWALRTANGHVIHEGEVGPPASRQDLERRVGLPDIAGRDKAHSFPARLGMESEFGISHATRPTNRSYQSDVEAFIQGFQRELPRGARLVLRTDTSFKPGTTHFQEQVYTLFDGVSRSRLFEVTIQDRAGKPEPIVDHIDGRFVHLAEGLRGAWRWKKG